MLAYKLSNNIDGNKLISDIQKLIQRSVQPSNQNIEHLLIITVKEITHDDNSLISKLEYHNI